MGGRIAQARTFLFVPANRPERFEKALRSGADVVIDLEDSIPSAEKVMARAVIEREWVNLRRARVPVALRMNDPGTEAGAADLAQLGPLESIAAVMIPKVGSEESLAGVHALLGGGVPLLPMIETVAGYCALPSLGAARGVLVYVD